MSKSILIVDDESDIRWVVETVARSMGYEQIYEAESGDEGLGIATRHRPYAVFTDVIMEGMSGPEMLLRILQILSYRPERVVVSSATKISYARGELQNYPVKITFLEKPFDINDLRDSLTFK